MLFQNDEDQKNIDFMPSVLAAERRREDRFAPILLFVIVTIILVLLIWAGLAEIDEVTRGDGKVIPSSKIQLVDHLEGGIIKEILVSSGDVVDKDQVLLRIDNTVAQARFAEGEELYYRYLAGVERLKALIDGKEFIVPEEVKNNAQAIAIDQMQQYEGVKQRLLNEQNIAQREVEQRKQEHIEVVNRLKELKQQYSLVKEEVNITAPLVKRGLAPKVDLLRLQREASEMRGEIDSTKTNIVKADAALKQAERRLKQVPININTELWRELRDTQSRLASAQESFKTEGERYSRTEVRSPVHGIIKQLLVSTVGGVIQPGEDLAEIVPLEDTLTIEAQVKPSDIAFLRPGLESSVKFSAYDYSIYGDMKATLVRISADTIEDDEGNSFYKIYLRTKGNKLSKSKEAVAVIPGMTVTVDILTGKKTILNYIMKPIIKTTSLALSER